MESTKATLKFSINPIWLFLVTSIGVPLVLAYTDEGNYDFSWVNDPGSWIALPMYSIALFLGQYIFYRLLKPTTLPWKLWFSIALGLIIGLTIMITAFYVMKYLFFS